MSNGSNPAKPGSYLEGPHTIGAWFASTDHKRIALMFLAWTLGAFLLGTIFNFILTVRPFGGEALTAHYLYQATTYHRLIMVFLFLIPAVPSVLGFFLLPMQLGAGNMALPTMSRCSLRFYATSLILVMLSFIWNPVSSGWTLPTPLSLGDDGAFGLLGLGLFFAALGWFLTGVNFLVTVHHKRRPGMGFFDMPILSWSLYLAGYQLAISGVLFCILIVYLVAGVYTGKGIFGLESDPLLWLRYFWFVITPVAFFAMIPFAGVISEIISGLGRRPVAGYRMVVGSLIALTGLGLLAGGVKLSGFGQAAETGFVFSFLGLLAAVPTALITFSWLSGLGRGAVPCSAPTSWVILFLLLAGVPVLMGLFLASPALGAYLGTTMFASTQLDYMIWGAAMGALLAGLHFWWPKMTGRLYNQTVARVGGFLYVAGLNLALVPRMLMGTGGVPQEMLFLEQGSTTALYVSSFGWMLALLSLVIVFGNLVSALWGRDVAGESPWNAEGPEWRTASPPSTGNFDDRTGSGL